MKTEPETIDFKAWVSRTEWRVQLLERKNKAHPKIHAIIFAFAAIWCGISVFALRQENKRNEPYRQLVAQWQAERLALKCWHIATP